MLAASRSRPEPQISMPGASGSLSGQLISTSDVQRSLSAGPGSLSDAPGSLSGVAGSLSSGVQGAFVNPRRYDYHRNDVVTLPGTHVRTLWRGPPGRLGAGELREVPTAPALPPRVARCCPRSRCPAARRSPRPSSRRGWWPRFRTCGLPPGSPRPTQR